MKDLVNGLLSISDINQLVGEYNTELRQLLDRHGPIETKTIVVRSMMTSKH